MPGRPPLNAGDPGDRRARGFGTRAVHPPEIPPQPGDPLAPLLDLSTTYTFEDAAQFAAASANKVGSGYVYTRWANPTIDSFEAVVADLEGAADAEAFATGMAAITSAFLGLASTGDRIVAARQLYGGTHAQLSETLPRFGIKTELLDVDDLDGIRASLPGARMLYCETIGNPRVKVADLDALGDVAAEAGVPMVVDNTFASPALCRPLEHGASLVMHSATKFLGGHLDLMGGVLCGSPEILARIREFARESGPTMSPFNAWLALRGIQTLHVRVERACATSLAIARALETHPKVGEVAYPGLDSSVDKPRTEALLGGRGGAMMGFDVIGGRAVARRFQDALQIVSPAASLGGTRSLIVHAASVTHTQLSAEELAAAGISEGFCRLSVGLEDAGDLIDDLTTALDAA